MKNTDLSQKIGREQSSSVECSPRSVRSGFTLIEILAATGIMVVIIMLVLSLTTNVLSSWTRASGQLQNNFEARVALDLLQSDLESMVVRNRNIVWMQVAYEPAGEHIGSSPVLLFFAPTLERPRKKSGNLDILGDVCAISYRLDFRNPFTGGTTSGVKPAPVFGLYRSVIDSENTFNQALAIPNFDNTIDSTLMSHWNSMDARTVNEQTNSVAVRVWAVSSENFLSQNVAKFDLLFWYRDSNNALIPIANNGNADEPPRRFVYTGSGLYLGNHRDTITDQWPYALGPGARLAYVDVTLTVISQEGAVALNEGEKSYDEILEEYGDVFTRRINLMSNPL